MRPRGAFAAPTSSGALQRGPNETGTEALQAGGAVAPLAGIALAGPTGAGVAKGTGSQVGVPPGRSSSDRCAPGTDVRGEEPKSAARVCGSTRSSGLGGRVANDGT